MGRRNGITNATGPQAITALEREVKAVALRRDGLTYEAIADQLGYKGRSGAQKAVTRALAQRSKERAGHSDALRQLIVERYERLIAATVPAAFGGVRKVAYKDDNDVDRVADIYVPPDPEAARVLLKALADEARLLGLYPSEKLEVTGKGGGPIEVMSPREQLLTKLDELAARRREKGLPPGPIETTIVEERRAHENGSG